MMMMMMMMMMIMIIQTYANKYVACSLSCITNKVQRLDRTIVIHRDYRERERGRDLYTYKSDIIINLIIIKVIISITTTTTIIIIIIIIIIITTIIIITIISLLYVPDIKNTIIIYEGIAIA